MFVKGLPYVNALAGRPLGAYDLGVATPRALVYAGVMTSGDARSCSDSIVEHCFDIIHSDLWTSPIWRNVMYDDRNAMYDEYNVLVKNGTWLLVPRPAGVNMVRSMWLFKHKFHADGTLSRYKARLVANGSSQQLGVDFDETFCNTPKLGRNGIMCIRERYITDQ
ncbi:ribonuclease H-like domain-containing protein [Tanacetum coccineum]|uniref:Ribonuclease H-like domain-containing protein n=1 Tax=Tanacetum coccineum TaxID=301880 RepID=A0ABQ5IRJ8_9ASTR